jgi:CTD kinase subunit beta
MPTPQTPPSPSSNPPLDPHPIVLQPAYPYFDQKQITALSSRLLGPLLSENKEVQIRLQACYWIEEVGNYLQWCPKTLCTRLIFSPVRTIGTAMMLYLRFHLFNRTSDFQFTVQTSFRMRAYDRMLRQHVFL